MKKASPRLPFRLSQVLLAGLAASLIACGGGGGGDHGASWPIILNGATPPATTNPDQPAGPTHTVSGTVSGLLGTGLVLQDNAGDDLSITADGSFSFATPVASGASYAVTVKTQPNILTRVCTVSTGSGTIADADVTDVAVNCTTPAARFGYLANLASHDVSSYTVDPASGALALMAQEAPGTHPGLRFVATDPAGRFAYEVTDTGIQAFSIDAQSGALSAVGTLTPMTATFAPSLTVDPTGRFAYAVNQLGGTSTIQQFNIDPVTGTLSPMAAPSVPAGSGSLLLTLDPLGRFAYAAAVNYGSVLQYNVDPVSGALSPMATPSVPAGPTPQNVAVHPSGRFAYVPGPLGSILQYTVDATGGLHPMTTPIYSTGVAITGLAVAPSGRFAYVLSASSVSIIAIDPTTGELSTTTLPPTSGGILLTSITVDPTGRFVYAADTIGARLDSFAIDVTTGGLSPLASPSAPTHGGGGLGSFASLALSR